MRIFIGSFLLIVILSCNKKVDIKLPDYEPELVVEMYLQQGKPLRCLLTQSLPYANRTINSMVNDALVVLSDGKNIDTLKYIETEDAETGRWYNYYNPARINADTTVIYTLTIKDEKNRTLSGSTSFYQRVVHIDSLQSRPAVNKKDSFSVGVVIKDPPAEDNYYRFLVTKKLNDFSVGSDPTDISISDISFNGKSYSFFSEPNYKKNDTVLVRTYSLTKEHFNYLQSTAGARSSIFNPFAQTSQIKSNVTGGLGIFTTIRFDQKRIVIK